LPGLQDKLSVLIGLPVERLNIFSAIKIDERKMGENLEQIAAISPISIGLAMRKFV
jgi:hypothetical protein